LTSTVWLPTVTPTARPTATNPAPSNAAAAAVTASKSLPTDVIAVAAVTGMCVLAAVCMGLRFCCRKRRRKSAGEHERVPLDEGFFAPTPDGGRRLEEGTDEWSSCGYTEALTVEEKELGGPPYEILPAALSAGRSQFLQIKYVPPRRQEYSPPPQPPMVHNRSGYRGVSAPVRGYRT
jgi:hypothetical protein